MEEPVIQNQEIFNETLDQISVVREKVLTIRAENLKLHYYLELSLGILHECTAVLSANDCERVSKIIMEARDALGKNKEV